LLVAEWRWRTRFTSAGIVSEPALSYTERALIHGISTVRAPTIAN
jgi:hypothetical protein